MSKNPFQPYKDEILALEKREAHNRLHPRKPRRRARIGSGVVSESHAQRCLVKWARMQNLPLIKISNEGKRGLIGGAIAKAEGLFAGASDLLLIKASRNYHGFFIEMKKSGKKLRPNQIVFMSMVEVEGYKAGWFDNWETAKLAIEEYLRPLPD